MKIDSRPYLETIREDAYSIGEFAQGAIKGIGHGLQTPFRAITGWRRMLSATDNSDSEAEFVGNILGFVSVTPLTLVGLGLVANYSDRLDVYLGGLVVTNALDYAHSVNTRVRERIRSLENIEDNIVSISEEDAA